MKKLFFSSLLIFLTGCSLSSPAPVSSVTPDYSDVRRGSYRGSYYEVKKGDTLYYIAYITDRDINEIIRSNNLKAPYTIFPGQKLDLWKPSYVAPNLSGKVAVKVPPVSSKTPSTGSSAKNQQNNQKYASKNKPDPVKNNKKTVDAKKSKEYSQTVTKSNKVVDKPVNKSKASSKAVSWSWPSNGRIISRFSSSERGNKGIDIAGQRGQVVTAAADGKVVYAGSALRGYGNLIIVKHNDDYLSAYAHNDRFFVSESQAVKKGQKIASMGSSGANSVRLHFEIRYKGKSVNPLRYLPKR